MSKWYAELRAKWRKKHIDMIRSKYADAAGRVTELQILLEFAELRLKTIDAETYWFLWATAMQHRFELREQLRHWQMLADKYYKQMEEVEDSL